MTDDRHAARLLWSAAEGTAQRREVESRLTSEASGPCWMCGLPCEPYGGVDAQQTVADSWSNSDLVASPSSRWLCAPCALAMAQRLPWPGRERLQRMQTYSHIVVDGVWYAATKAQPWIIRDTLVSPPRSPWFAGITTTGQKHMVFRSPVNDCGDRPPQTVPWRVRFEETIVTCTPERFTQLLDCAERLYRRGFNKLALLTGEPSIKALSDDGALNMWDTDYPKLRPLRGSPLLQLVVFLIRKEDRDGSDDAAQHPQPGGGPGDRGAQEHQLGPHRPAEVLGATDGHAEDRGEHIQLTLFGDGASR